MRLPATMTTEELQAELKRAQDKLALQAETDHQIVQQYELERHEKIRAELSARSEARR